MSNINGFDNEFEFVKYLNGKQIRELNPSGAQAVMDFSFCRKNRGLIYVRIVKYLDLFIKKWYNSIAKPT